MEQRLLLNLGQGDWHTGFASVTAQLWENEQPPMQFVGSLPPMPQLAAQYQRWQQLYEAIYGSQSRWRRAASPFEFEAGALTNVSHQEFATLCTTLHTDLNQWLMADTFAPHRAPPAHPPFGTCRPSGHAHGPCQNGAAVSLAAVAFV